MHKRELHSNFDPIVPCRYKSFFTSSSVPVITSALSASLSFDSLSWLHYPFKPSARCSPVYPWCVLLARHHEALLIE